MAKTFDWSIQQGVKGAELLNSWEGGFLIQKAEVLRATDAGAALIELLMSADRSVAAAQARAAFNSGTMTQEGLDVFLGALGAAVPGANGTPLGARQKEADALGLGEAYSLTTSYALNVFRSATLFEGNRIRAVMAGPELGFPWIPVTALGVAAIIGTSWVGASFVVQKLKSEVRLTATKLEYAGKIYALNQHNQQQAVLGKPYAKPAEFGSLQGPIDAERSASRAPWIAAGALAALAVVEYRKKGKTTTATTRHPAPLVRVANPRRGRRTVAKPKRRRAAKAATAKRRAHPNTYAGAASDAQLSSMRANSLTRKAPKGQAQKVHALDKHAEAKAYQYAAARRATEEGRRAQRAMHARSAAAHGSTWLDLIDTLERTPANEKRIEELYHTSKERARAFEGGHPMVIEHLDNAADYAQWLEMLARERGDAKQGLRWERNQRADVDAAWELDPRKKKNPNPARKRNPTKKRRAKEATTARRCKKCAGGACPVHQKGKKFGHDKRPAKYAGIRRDQFGFADRWMYPLNTVKRVQAAARFFGKYCDRYPAKMRNEIARNIDKAEKKFKIGKYEKKA